MTATGIKSSSSMISPTVWLAVYSVLQKPPAVTWNVYLNRSTNRIHGISILSTDRQKIFLTCLMLWRARALIVSKMETEVTTRFLIFVQRTINFVTKEKSRKKFSHFTSWSFWRDYSGTQYSLTRVISVCVPWIFGVLLSVLPRKFIDERTGSLNPPS